MKKVNTKLIIIIIAAVIVLSFVISWIYKKVTTFSYEKHLDDVVITVDDTSVTLREFGCYIYDVEGFIQQQALAYDSESPSLWWNTHFAAGYDSAFISDYAKRTALDMCACYEIYYAEALSAGMSLDSSEEAKAKADADQMYLEMNEYQRQVTGLSCDCILEVKKKQALASKYMGYLMENTDFSGYTDDPQTLLNWDGDYYKTFIYSKHSIKQNDSLLQNITLGTITVNYE